MMAPAMPTSDAAIQKTQRTLGTQNVMAVRTAPLTMATAAWGVAMRTVLVRLKP